MKIKLDPYKKNSLFKTVLLDIMYRDTEDYSIQQYHFTHRDTYLYIDFNKRTGLYQLFGSHFSTHHFSAYPTSTGYIYMQDYNLKEVVREYDYILFNYMEFRCAMY